MDKDLNQHLRYPTLSKGWGARRPKRRATPQGPENKDGRSSAKAGVPESLNAGQSKRRVSVFESSCHLLLPSNNSIVEAIPLSALPKDTNKRICWLVLHTIPLMLKVEQGSCEYQLLKAVNTSLLINRKQKTERYKLKSASGYVSKNG